MGRAAKIVAPVDQGQMLGDRLQIESPIERRIAAAHDHHMFAAKILDPAHRVMDGFSFIVVDAGDRWFLRLERASPRRHDNGLAFEILSAAGADAERRRIVAPQNLQGLDHFPVMKGWVKRLDLLQQSVDQLLAGDFRETRNIIDRLFGIKLRALAARFWQDIDQMGFDVEETKLEHGEETGGTGADDDDIGFYTITHSLLRTTIERKRLHGPRPIPRFAAGRRLGWP